MNITTVYLLTTLFLVSDDARFTKNLQMDRQWNAMSSMEVCEEGRKKWLRSYEGLHINGVQVKPVATCIER